jgi:predicted transcriptional regulator
MGFMSLWPRFQKYFLCYDDLGFSIDISRMRFADDFFDQMKPRIEKAYVDMLELEAGAIAKKAATRILELQAGVKKVLSTGSSKTPEEIARAIGADLEDVFHILRHIRANE